ncbi:hypothetical protein LQ564_08700 [Massilia sp. G4R7]|uniref:Uncharacterized protein n=1 Tax=Massilia phyllostachyos TaxID=2898585 RepID=A0ABS8Q5Z6_9BURK|nr:hypothetical protein [Massilia phyllostachyos]MCD2516391.1 hypothetical protein [Massilia phyllostachyos]
MALLLRLFSPRRRKTQMDVAGRAAEVVVQVLYDVGVDRFLAGSMLLDRRLRICFYAAPPIESPIFLAKVPVRELTQARAFAARVEAAGFDAALERHVAALVEELMDALCKHAPGLRALPRERGSED